jgi:iron complex outermembrane receptor protein
MRGSTVAVAALLLGVSLPTLGLAAGSGTEALVAQAQSFTFAIPPQSLTSALVRYAAITGLDLAYDGVVADGLQSPGTSGTLGRDQALTQLLSGTGIGYRFSGDKSLTLYKLPVSTYGSTTLAPLVIEGRARTETAWGPIDGYVAKRSATGTKTDTPLNETPQSISVIGREQMNIQGVTNIASALRYSPGMTGELYGQDVRGFGLQIRGFGASDEAFYRDGLQLKGSGNASFLPLDLYGAEKFEILRGPSSVLFGQNSPGGLINYISRRPSDVFSGEVEGVVGNFNRREGKFDVTGPANDSGTLLYRFTGLARDSEMQVDHVDDDRVFFAPAFTWKPNEDTSITLLANYQKDDTGWGIQFLPGLGTELHNPNGTIRVNRFLGEPDYDKYLLEQGAIGYQAEHKLNDTFTFRQNLRFSHLENDQQAVYADTLQADDRTLTRIADMGKSTLSSIVVDNQAQAKFDTGPAAHTFLAGFDYQRHAYRDTGASGTAGSIDIFDPVYGATPIGPMTEYSNVRQTMWQAGIYAQEQMKLFEKLVLVAGGRYDWTSKQTDDRLAGGSSTQKDQKFTGRLGAVYLTDIGLSPYVSYSESFLPQLGTDFAGKTFDPDGGRQYEVGVKYQPEGSNSSVNVALFDLVRQNMLTADTDNVGFQKAAGEARSRGLEIEAIGNLADGLNVIAAYAYYDTEFTKNNDGTVGNTPYGVAKHRASLWADYRFESGLFRGFGLGGGVRYTGQTFGGDDNGFKVDDYTLTDATMSYQFGGYRLGINASNIFNERYVTSCSGPTTCFYGTGRTVTASLKYSW